MKLLSRLLCLALLCSLPPIAGAQTPSDSNAASSPSTSGENKSKQAESKNKKARKPAAKAYTPTAEERELLDAAPPTPSVTATPGVPDPAAPTPSRPVPALSSDDPHSPRMPAAVPLAQAPTPPAPVPAKHKHAPAVAQDKTPASPAAPAAKPATPATNPPSTQSAKAAPKPTAKPSPRQTAQATPKPPKAPKPAKPTPAAAPAATVAAATTPRLRPLPRGPLTRSVTLTIASNGAATQLTLTDLQRLPQHVVSAPDANGSPIVYTGPLVADILNRAGLPSTADPQSPILQSFVRVTSTDGHSVLFSAAELEPQLSSGLVILALRRDGALLPLGMQLVDPLDSTPVRWVQAVNSLSIVTLDP